MSIGGFRLVKAHMLDPHAGIQAEQQFAAVKPWSPDNKIDVEHEQVARHDVHVAGYVFDVRERGGGSFRCRVRREPGGPKMHVRERLQKDPSDSSQAGCSYPNRAYPLGAT